MIDINLMIVEDDKQLRDILSKILLREVSHINVYSKPSEALNAINTVQPDLIITDIKMPGMNGLEMIKVIRRLYSYSDIPVIIVSAFNEQEYFIKAIDAKVNHFLTKPVDIPKLLTMIKDIYDDIRVKHELQEQTTLLNQYKHIVDLSSNITITDPKGIIIYVNDKFCDLSGYTKDELIGKPHNIVRDPDVPKSFYKNLWRTILNKQIWQGIIKNKSKDGTNFYIETTISPILNKEGEIIEFISIKTNITKLIKAKKKLQDEIVTDRLTSLPNRVKLQEDIRKEKDATLIILDINHFKEINLLFGSKLGDRALIYLAKVITELTSSIKGTCIYRVSADEFAVLKPGDCLKELEALARSVYSFIRAQPFHYKEISFDINLTCGIAYKKEHIKHLLEDAHDALESAKKEKHFLHIFDETVSKQHEYEKNFEWTKKIKEALAEDRIKAYFQPIYDVQKESITKYESLVRLIEKDGTVISPFVFLEVAKHSRLYKSITKTMIMQGCAMFVNRKEVLTINVSIEDLLDESTINFLINTVSENNMQNRVIAEVLESEGVENFEIFSDVVTRLKKNGIRIAIDDFGSGYSNFSYLTNMEIDILKIDGSLVRNVNINANSKILLQSIVMFAHEMGMQTVAEFVSDKKIFDTVKLLGINLMQGYYISKPLEKPLAENIVLDLSK